MEGRVFGGFFEPALPKRCFASDGGKKEAVVLSAILADTHSPAVVDLDKASVAVHRKWPGAVVTDALADMVVAARSTRIVPHK